MFQVIKLLISQVQNRLTVWSGQLKRRLRLNRSPHPKTSRKSQQWSRLIIGTCLLTWALHSPAWTASPNSHQANIDVQPTHQITHQIAQAEQQPTQAWQQALTDGILAFEEGRLSEAIAHWQTALSVSQRVDQPLTRAYLLSNIAIAQQQLGEHTAAEGALSEALTITEGWSEPTQLYWEVSARVLNTQGQWLFHQGESQQALAVWQQAEQHYRRALESGEPASSSATPSDLTPGTEATTLSLTANPSLGLVRSQLNQAIARQELGFSLQAAQQLSQLSQQISPSSNSTNPDSTTSRSSDESLNVQIAAVSELGKALRQIGELSHAHRFLTETIQALETRGVDQSSPELNQLRLELGHTFRALSHSAIAIGKADSADTYRQQTLGQYTTVSESVAQSNNLTATRRELQSRAQLNQLSYLIEIGQLSTAETLQSSVNLSDLPAGRGRTEATISYAHSLSCLKAPTAIDCVKRDWQDQQTPLNPSATPNWETIGQTLAAAIRQADTLNDLHLSATARGELGHLYELTGQTSEAIQLTQQALARLEGTQSPEATYRWEWQLGRLLQNQPSNQSSNSSADLTQAINSYQQAITSLDRVRQNLLRVNPQAQFSFRDDAEPLYREYVTLLLASEATSKQQQSDRLALAVKTLDSLQVTELENFLGCNLAQLVNLTEMQTAGDPNAVKIYPILLPNKLATIVDLPGQPLTLETTALSQSQVESTLSNLQTALTTPGKTPEVIESASQLYDWIIRPLEPLLASNEQIETLVFVPDGPLRNLPMSVLYDGEQYLVEKKYAIAIAPQLTLFAPRATPTQLKILSGGIGLPQTIRDQSFPPIELVETELDQIPEELTAAPPLLDTAFTKENIEAQITQEDYTAIHWKTHGIFSADPAETFLVAYEESISASELSDLIRTARDQQVEPLELLVLSACETAQGDRRAVLGLAGIAVRAGTRSTLSTLWRADDGANTQLIDVFYQGLQAGLTKAKALQQSQQQLLTEAGYPAPYYWAPYVLVGNWL